MKKKKIKTSRRSFLVKSSAAATGLFLVNPLSWAKEFTLDKELNSEYAGVQIGVTTYSFISMPHYKDDVTEVLKYIVKSGLNATELKGEAVEGYLNAPKDKNELADWRSKVSMDKFVEIREMFEKAGVNIYAFKPSNSLEKNNTDEEIEYALRAGKALGADSVSVELQDPSQTKRLGKFAKKHQIPIGYHTHTQATDTVWDEALEQSQFNTINLDCGHYIAAGGNNTKYSLLAFIESNHKKITSIHLKDRKLKINGGENMPWGEGDTPIEEILTLMREKGYKFPATIELEYEIPSNSNAIKETEKCRKFAKDILLDT